LDRAPPSPKMSEKEVELYSQSIEILQNETQNPENILKIKLDPGKLFVTNNWRVMHGRTGFTGRRRLLGSYIGMDTFLSKIRILSESEYI